MKSYIDIVKHILDTGQWKENRTGIRCLTTFCEIFRHDMSGGFPLLTTKRMPLKTIAVELEGFIKGITSKSWFQERNCHIWDEWANPQTVDYVSGFVTKHSATLGITKTKKEIQKDEDDLGPIYGYQWRRFNECYDEEDNGWVDGKEKDKADQLKTIVDTLKTNPDDRRMVCSAWNPLQISRMALPPCHVLFNIQHVNGTLNLVWFQRSCDLGLGVGFNIASYSLLLLLLCKEANMIPGELVGILSDCHIYENQLTNIKKQIERPPFSLPSVEIIPDKEFNIFHWTHKDFVLSDYQRHPSLKLGEVAG